MNATTNITELAEFFPESVPTKVVARPKGRVANRFTRGSARFECKSCGRGTRDTGRGDNEGVGLCEQCYELAGYENHLSDGYEFTDTDKRTVNEYLRQLSTFIGQKAYDLHPELVAVVTKAPNRGVNPEKVSKAVVTEVAQAEPSRLVAAAKPTGAQKVAVNLKARSKVVVKAPAKKAAPAKKVAPEPKFSDWMVWAGDTVIDVIMGEHETYTRAEAQKKMSMRYNGPVTVTTVQEGHARDAYLKTLRKGKVKATPAPKAAKAPSAPRAPSTKLPDDTLYYVAPVAEGKPARKGQTAINMAVLEKLKRFTRASALEALTPSVGLVEAKSVWADGKSRSIIQVAPAAPAKKAKK